MTAEPGSAEHPTAFAPDSIRNGAVISYDGDALLVTGESIVSVIESRFTASVSTPERTDQWLTGGVPLLSRGDAWIVPLSWQPPLPVGNDFERRMLGERLSELWSQVKGACWYRHGNQIGVDLDPDPTPSPQRSYALELVRTGARRADWWAFGEWAVVLIVYGEPVPAPLVQIAVQVVPKSWVWEVRGRARVQKGPFTDLSWSWANVVDFARAEEGRPNRRS